MNAATGEPLNDDPMLSFGELSGSGKTDEPDTAAAAAAAAVRLNFEKILREDIPIAFRLAKRFFRLTVFFFSLHTLE